MNEETETPKPADVAGRIDGLVGRIKLKPWGGVANYSAWHLLPTVRFGLWDHRVYLSKNHGGFLAFTWLKFDAGLMWTVLPPNA